MPNTTSTKRLNEMVASMRKRFHDLKGLKTMYGSLSRRHWLRSISSGFGYLAFAGLSTAACQRQHAAAQGPATNKGPTGDGSATATQGTGAASASSNPLAAKTPHFPASAKRVIFLCMSGAPSHVDTFDYKPQLDKDHGKPGRYGGRLLKSQWKFRQRGESGLWISELFDNVAQHADDLCLIRSMHCDQPVHPGAQIQMHTGTAQFVRPSLGAWTLYGLGTENESLPGFISLNPPPASAQNYGSAFLPAIYGGTSVGPSVPQGGMMGRRFAGNRNPVVPDIASRRLNKKQQRTQLDLIQSLNRNLSDQMPHEPQIDAAIDSLELAFRMQDSLPAVMDLSDETAETLALYGADQEPTATFGKQCLIARRMAEKGVRFIEVTKGAWDHHQRLSIDLPQRCQEIDQPIAGLLADLKRRDMLNETLVIWGGEFGRTPAAQNGDGRDHNNKGYTIWMAGGGVQGGTNYGATDPHGYEAVEDPCHVHDWHATVLHLLGLNHKRLTFNYAGRDFRLTDVYGNVIKKIIAT